MRELSDREKAIDAWRTLYYSNLLSDKESESIKKKINTRYKKDKEHR